MSPLLSEGPIQEHCGYPDGLPVGHYFAGEAVSVWPSIYFKGSTDCYCIEIRPGFAGKVSLHSSYYVGTDWLEKGKLAVYVEPKLNNESRNTDYFKMLFSGLTNPDIGDFLPGVFEMKIGEPEIELPQHLDLLTPLLIFQFLLVMKLIVRKGLKKSYEPVVANLNGRVKGKILVGQQLKTNLAKNRLLQTVCAYTEFNVNGLENRILKKALNFSLRYLEQFRLKEYKPMLDNLVNYIRPAFAEVSPIADINDIRHVRVNPFFKEYREGLRLAELIFKRYGYNINSVSENTNLLRVPPFWIDMSKLYELYVLSKLREQPYRHLIRFQLQGKYGKADFLLCGKGKEVIMDAKYKPSYEERYMPDDIRQLSGYARDKGMLRALGLDADDPELNVVDCLIIYPVKTVSVKTGLAPEELLDDPIAEFSRFFKKSIELPYVQAD